ncbi:transcriptional repressor TraM [Sinorhizobium medicae]|uniref:Putative transcriptional repressor TraM n=1 Tax=Sinorhizobium medicae TaxID=110321 RepID=A0A508XAX5_9HYPH|nr:transcriptional repressor TraM [Sinorhizobium medicae]MDX0521677.1 transcriptional regulator [Sinorhizobium medicae]MDX0694644.1 transcriptional regulator [Sinorhizobium medicae]MDX0712549.1 transcriptional regulator [Sinorhizobium medicae]MDX0743827.1 transcriptional regulator [Sinorhizobium medicae]MDX0771832.1 transcriptional regulator [Sinorhizobium medicae]
MHTGNSSETNEEEEPTAPCFVSLQKSDLEVLAVSAIREHRRLIAADEGVYEEWARATTDPSVPAAVLKSLQDEYVARQKKSEAQQDELSKIIDALGYVPDLSLEGEQ